MDAPLKGDEQRIVHLLDGEIKFGKGKNAETFKKGQSVHAVLSGKLRKRSPRSGIGSAEFALPDAWVEDIMLSHMAHATGEPRPKGTKSYGYYIVRVES